MLVGALVDRRVDRGELFARGQQEGTDGGGAPDVLVLEQRLEAIPALAQEHRILAATLAPGDEVVARVGRRAKIPAIGLDGGGEGRTDDGWSGKGSSGKRGRTRDEAASLQDNPPWRGPLLGREGAGLTAPTIDTGNVADLPVRRGRGGGLLGGLRCISVRRRSPCRHWAGSPAWRTRPCRRPCTRCGWCLPSPSRDRATAGPPRH